MSDHDHFLSDDDRDELKEKFTCQEVESAEEVLECLEGPTTAYNFRRMLMLLLRGHYSSGDNYMDFEHLKCYTWNPDDKYSKLSVEMTHEGDDSRPDSYPGVYVGFSSLKLEKLGLSGNFAERTQDNAGTFISKEATAVFSIHHVAKRAQDAWDLAELSALFLQAIGSPISQRAGATGFEITGINEPKEKKPSPEEYYTVAISVEIKYTQSVSRNIESHRVRQIFIELTTQS